MWVGYVLLSLGLAWQLIRFGRTPGEASRFRRRPQAVAAGGGLLGLGILLAAAVAEGDLVGALRLSVPVVLLVLVILVVSRSPRPD